MLVLSRHRGDEIIIGEGDKKIVITVVDIFSNTTRIGIDAPKEVRIDRGEIREKIDARHRAKEQRNDRNDNPKG